MKRVLCGIKNLERWYIKCGTQFMSCFLTKIQRSCSKLLSMVTSLPLISHKLWHALHTCVDKILLETPKVLYFIYCVGTMYIKCNFWFHMGIAVCMYELIIEGKQLTQSFFTRTHSKAIMQSSVYSLKENIKGFIFNQRRECYRWWWW